MSGKIEAKGPLREASIAIQVIRADGTVEDRGVVSYYHKNPLKRWIWAIKQRRMKWQPKS